MIERYTSFSLVFVVAVATILLAGQAQGTDLCQKADYPVLCRSIVKGTDNPNVATAMAISKLIISTKRAKTLATKLGTSKFLGDCKDSYDDAIDNLKTCLGYLKTGDKGSLNSNLSGTLASYVSCDDAFQQFGKPSPLGRKNASLQRKASNALYLAGLIH